MRHKNRNESTVFYKEIINAHSQNEHESVITECLSQTQRVTNLLRLQNTTFQTCSRSKYSPIIPRLIFKASLFSPSFLPPQIPEPRAAEWESERQRRWGEHLNLAFREWSSRCLEIFHILFTPGRFQPGTAESWQGPPPGHSSSLSFLSAPCLPRPKDFSLQTFPHRLLPINTFKPKANKHKSTSLPSTHGRRNTTRVELKILIKRILLMWTRCGQITQRLL